MEEEEKQRNKKRKSTKLSKGRKERVLSKAQQENKDY